MNQKILGMKLEINRQKTGKEVLACTGIGREDNRTVYSFGLEGIQAEVILTEEQGVLAGRICLEIKNEAFRENNNLSLITPVSLSMELEKQPEKMTAMYLHRDWWTRPKFISGFEEMPERTQSLYIKYAEGTGYLLPLAGERFKTMGAPGGQGRLALHMTAYMGGMNRVEEPLFLLTESPQLYDAIHRAFSLAADMKGIPMKGDKEYPEMFEYLGWCSWDAFYTEISEDKVREKARELTDKKVPVRWFLMDDGWLAVREQRLYDLMPERKKFPQGFPRMIHEIKQESGIRWFGVWHALGGYWGGIEPGSSAAEAGGEDLYRTNTDKLLPYPEAERGYGFFRKWYELLRRQGIDFVKVDGQSAIKNYYENQIPVSQAAKGTHEALEGAAAAYFHGNLINCMGMGMENILNRPGSALTRNSDDFVPDNETGFGEHLLQNAYNAPYHDELYYCDWDMFWTFHPDGEKHGILRAISGGPVYISDRIGDTRMETIAPIIYEDGRILRMDRTAKPSPDTLFTDPEKEGLLKLTNLADSGWHSGEKAGAIAVYNISPKEQSTAITTGDIHDLKEGNYYLYDYRSSRGHILTKEAPEQVSLLKGGYGLYLLTPVKQVLGAGGVSVIGLIDKYISFHPVSGLCLEKNMLTLTLSQPGCLAFYSERPVQGICANGKDITGGLTCEKGLCKVNVKGKGPQQIRIRL